MNILWTRQSTFPKKLYRVCRQYQQTCWDPKVGFTAADKKSFFPCDTQISDFITSLLLHRRQDKYLSPYISFFESRKEAEQWCIAAEQTFGYVCQIAVLDLTSQVMKQGLKAGLFKGWRLADIVRRLGIKDPNLALGSGGASMADSEWLFLNYVPAAAISEGPTSTTLRASKFYVLDLGVLTDDLCRVWNPSRHTKV